ncbi:hypothetical protein E0Z10_g11017 [Xylaria hypoxylon]|uniref:Uncharacterized protein n=1 Tax=Xylaria hypoxylon TaxID=37992 RepID=A0A4Z0Y5Y6_9PEZI|nr:hypothetical protein E0Z10_g11017 [Xylaria hypoxylon]
MRLDSFTALIIIFRTAQCAPSLPLNRRLASSSGLEASSCAFYGYVDNKEVYNEYTIEMAGWGNDGSSSCALGISGIIQTQCRTKLDNFACAQVYENLHDTQISFRINKAAVAQPDCVTEALKLASSNHHDEQTIECYCLAECWASQTML